MEDLSSFSAPNSRKTITTGSAPVTGREASKFYTSCGDKAKESLSCLEMHQENKSVCQDLFDAYKDCRKAEHAGLLAERRRNS